MQVANFSPPLCLMEVLMDRYQRREVSMNKVQRIEHKGLTPSERPPQLATWFWDGMIRHSVPCVVAGYPESGKGIFVEMLALSTAAGSPLYGRQVNGGKPGKVLFVSAEDDQEELRARAYDLADAMHIDPSYLLNLELRSTIDLQVPPPLFDKAMSPTPLIMSIRDYCETYSPSLVVLDTLAAFAPSGIELQSASSIATQYITMITAMLRPATVLWTCHLRKPSTLVKGKTCSLRPSIFDVRDSSALVGSARSVMILHDQQLSLDKCNGRMRCAQPVGRDIRFSLAWKTAPGCKVGMLELTLASTREWGASKRSLSDRQDWQLGEDSIDW